MATILDSIIASEHKTIHACGRYTAGDAENDAKHLYHLLDVAFETLLEVNFGADPAGRGTLDRLSAILWIARDCAERIGDGLEVAA